MTTTEPGMQLYTSFYIDGQPGKGGLVYKKYGGFTTEAQHYPNSPNEVRNIAIFYFFLILFNNIVIAYQQVSNSPFPTWLALQSTRKVHTIWLGNDLIVE